MLTVEEIREGLRDRNLRAVARSTGLHPNTVYTIADGKNTNPSHRTLKKLSDYLGGAR